MISKYLEFLRKKLERLDKQRFPDWTDLHAGPGISQFEYRWKLTVILMVYFVFPGMLPLAILVSLPISGNAKIFSMLLLFVIFFSAIITGILRELKKRKK